MVDNARRLPSWSLLLILGTLASSVLLVQGVEEHKRSRSLAPLAQECDQALNDSGYAAVCWYRFASSQESGTNLTSSTSSRNMTEYECTHNYTTLGCEFEFACHLCTAEQVDSFRTSLEQGFDANAQKCAHWSAKRPKLLGCSEYPLKEEDGEELTCTERNFQKNSNFCQKKANEKYPKVNEVKDHCMGSFHALACLMRTVCLCDSTEEYVTYAEERLKELKPECQTWWASAPKLACTHNTVTIMIVVIVLILGSVVVLGCTMHFMEHSGGHGAHAHHHHGSSSSSSASHGQHLKTNKTNKTNKTKSGKKSDGTVKPTIA